jgi:hypothetical protein
VLVLIGALPEQTNTTTASNAIRPPIRRFYYPAVRDDIL